MTKSGNWNDSVDQLNERTMTCVRLSAAQNIIVAKRLSEAAEQAAKSFALRL